MVGSQRLCGLVAQSGALHRALDQPLAIDPGAVVLQREHDLVALSGSLVIGLAVSAGRLETGEGWAVSRIDETWQQELWGVDEEAAKIAERKRGEFHDAARLLELVRR